MLLDCVDDICVYIDSFDYTYIHNFYVFKSYSCQTFWNTFGMACFVRVSVYKIGVNCIWRSESVTGNCIFVFPLFPRCWKPVDHEIFNILSETQISSVIASWIYQVLSHKLSRMRMKHNIDLIFVLKRYLNISHSMMTSSNGNISALLAICTGKSSVPRLIPRTKASDAELWYFLRSAAEYTAE